MKLVRALFFLGFILPILEGSVDHQTFPRSWFQRLNDEGEMSNTWQPSHTSPTSNQIIPTFLRAFSTAIRRQNNQVGNQWAARDEEEEEEKRDTAVTAADEEEEDDDEKLLEDVKDFELTEDDFIEAIISTQVTPDSEDKKGKGGGSGGDDSDNSDSSSGSGGGIDLDELADDEDSLISASNKAVGGKGSEDDLQEQYYSISTIKRLWKDFIQPPPSKETLDDVIKHAATLSRVNGTDRETFYKQLLLQLLDPMHPTTATTSPSSTSSSSVAAKKIQWLDQEFVLGLKGVAVLSLYPHTKERLLGGDDVTANADTDVRGSSALASKLTRSIRLVGGSSEKDKSGGQSQSGKSSAGNPSGLYTIHQMIVKALAHSIQANLVIVNQKTIEKIQELAEREGVARKYLSKATIIATLFESNDDTSETATPSPPLIVAFNDNCKWLFHNTAVSQTILDELKNRASRVFFIAMEPTDDIKVGHVPPSAQNTLASGNNGNGKGGNGGNEGEENNGQSMFPNFSSLFPGFPAGPPSPNQAPPNHHHPPGPGPVFLPPGQGFPPLPPGAQPMMISRAFQVVVQNGTATMTPLPPGAMPMGMPMMPMMSSPFPPAPLTDDQKKKMIAEYEKFVEREKKRNPNGPTPPEMTEEDIDDIQDFLKDPQNLENIRKTVESMMTNIHRFNPKNTSAMSLPPPQVITQWRMAKLPPPPSPQQPPQTPPQKIPAVLSSNKSPTSSRVYHKEDVDESAVTSAGKTVLSFFEDVSVDPPRDHLLRLTWDRVIDEEICSRIVRANRRIFQQELRKYAIPYDATLFFHVDDLLKQQAMSREQVKDVIVLAVKLQAGRLSPLHTTTSHQNNNNKMELTLWAIDTALSSVLKVTSPRLGKPVARSKEEISNIAMDKHERALVSNVISPQDIGVTYEMIGGLEEVKELMRQCITYPLKYPRLYSEGVAAEAVKGLLLFGPPGTGKTMLAKAVATEGGATFLSIDASTIENKWLGESEKNARAVFTLARKLAPCVIYLDEVDSILSSREHGDESSHGTLTSVKTTLMQEWDGLRTTSDRVVVIASTNRPFDLDEAVLRRLPRRIMVDLPDQTTRADILSVTLANNRIAADVNFTKLAEQLDGYTGSDIKEVCREAVVRVAHERAQMLEGKLPPITRKTASDVIEGEEVAEGEEEEVLDVNAPLRAVTLEDFKVAMKKLKASVNENGRELQKVMDWNEKYGEIKRSKNGRRGGKSQSAMTMYI